MTVILPQFHYCDCEMCEWPNFGTLFKFPCIVRIYAWFFMHCINHHSDSHANHVIIYIFLPLAYTVCIISLHSQVHPNHINTLRPTQNGRHFADDIFICIFVNENGWVSINISPNFIPKGEINNMSALVQIMAWRRPGDKPLSEPMIVSLLTHICVTRHQWFNHQQALCVLARARPAVPLGLWSITSSLRGNLYVPRLHKFIKWFADNDVAHRN